jgi:hypothetical protein
LTRRLTRRYALMLAAAVGCAWLLIFTGSVLITVAGWR